MLVAILMLYFQSDLVRLAAVSDLTGGEAAVVKWAELQVAPGVTERLRADPTNGGRPLHTFNLPALAAMGQAGRAWVLDQATWAAKAGQVRAVYDALLAKAPLPEVFAA